MPGFTHQSSITSAFRVSKTSQCGSSSKPIVLTDDTNNGDSSSETDVVVAPAVPPTTPPKRKRDDSHEAVEEIQRPPKPSPLIAAYRSEKRPLPLRNRPLETFQRKIQEAVRFRLHILSYTNVDDYQMDFIVGTSNENIFDVKIKSIPYCSCLRGSTRICCHIIWILRDVMKVPYNMQYQSSFLYSELFEFICLCPEITLQNQGNDKKIQALNNDCPICMEPLRSNETELKPLVYCRFSCCNVFHGKCLKKAISTAKGMYHITARCPLCRQPWNEKVEVKQKKSNNKGERREMERDVAEVIHLS